MTKAFGYAAHSLNTPLVPFEFERREVGKDDLLIEILYCGICHSDVHMARNEWHQTVYPIVPGHEILGRVKQIGADVHRFKVGDLVGVGCIIGSCGRCGSCHDQLEQYCSEGFTLVFNSPDLLSGGRNYGGFSDQIVVREKYVLRIPSEFSEQDLPAVAPLLCAGITTYSPLKHWKVGPGKRVGIVGLGGLGHMAVKIAHAMGAIVVVFTTSESKRAEARQLGADEVVLSTNKEAMREQMNRFDFLLSTVSSPYDLNPYLELLQHDGAMCLVGLPPKPHPSLRADLLIDKRRAIVGSLIGSIQETQEMLDFCAQHRVLATIELIPMDQVNQAFERILQNAVKYRFVIDRYKK